MRENSKKGFWNLRDAKWIFFVLIVFGLTLYVVFSNNTDNMKQLVSTEGNPKKFVLNANGDGTNNDTEDQIFMQPDLTALQIYEEYYIAIPVDIEEDMQNDTDSVVTSKEREKSQATSQVKSDSIEQMKKEKENEKLEKELQDFHQQAREEFKDYPELVLMDTLFEQMEMEILEEAKEGSGQFIKDLENDFGGVTESQIEDNLVVLLDQKSLEQGNPEQGNPQLDTKITSSDENIKKDTLISKATESNKLNYDGLNLQQKELPDALIHTQTNDFQTTPTLDTNLQTPNRETANTDMPNIEATNLETKINSNELIIEGIQEETNNQEVTEELKESPQAEAVPERSGNFFQDLGKNTKLAARHATKETL